MLGWVKGLGTIGWSILGLGGATTAINVVNNPKDGLVANWGSDFYTTLMNMQTEAGVDTGWQGFYKFFEKMADFIESFTGEGSMMALRNWAKRGMGESEFQHSSTNLNWSDGQTTLAGSAGADTLGINYTPENALTIDNFTNVEGALSGENILHKAHVLTHGFAEGAVHVVNITGHIADAADTVTGWGAKLFGYDTGYADRNLSKDFHKALMTNVVDPIIPAPELKTAWDRAIHFGGELLPSIATGYFAAPLVHNALLNIAVSPSLNTGAIAGTTLGDVFLGAVSKLGMATTSGVAANTAVSVGIIPGLDRG